MFTDQLARPGISIRWMCRSATTLSVLLLCSLLSSCASVQVIEHDPDAAAKVAIEFAKRGYVNKDFKEAYILITQDSPTPLTEEAVKTVIEKMHPDGYPDKVDKLGYEPLPGQRAMNILLLGTDSKKNEYHYRLVMTGDAKQGYKVGGLFRGNKAYPQSPLFKKF
jgi:hypothetical protein